MKPTRGDTFKSGSLRLEWSQSGETTGSSVDKDFDENWARAPATDEAMKDETRRVGLYATQAELAWKWKNFFYNTEESKESKFISL